MHSMKKGLIVTGVILIMVSGLAGCTKTTEKTDETGASAVEAENLPLPGETEGGEENGGLQDTGNNGEEDGTQDLGSKADQGGTDASGEEFDLYGDICEVGDMQFTVTEIYNETLEDGSGIMVMGAEEDSLKITVVYDENTVLEKQKIWDGGASHEEREGTAADLQKGFTAEMNGSYEGDVFHATRIKIVEVIL